MARLQEVATPPDQKIVWHIGLKQRLSVCANQTNEMCVD